MSRTAANQSPTPPSTTPLVGRERDLELLRERLSAALAGNGSLVCIGGEPGIGKTRLAEEVADAAASSGAVVAWGSCPEWAGAPPYWPWRQIVRALSRTPALADQQFLSRGSDDLRQFLEPGDETSTGDGPGSPYPERARLRLFDAVTSFLMRAAEQRPLALVLDDAHWADVPSLLLLHYLAADLANSAVLVLATYRDTEVDRDHRLFPILSDLTRQHGNRRLILAALTPHEVSQYVALVSGQAPDSAILDAIIAETDGNPLFVTEIVRLLASEGGLDARQATLPTRTSLPETVRETILRRVDRLPAPTREMLDVAAVIGRVFSASVLRSVLAQPTATTLALLDAAVKARVISELDDTDGYRFSHVLIQEALYRELPSARRAQLHQQVGETLERLFASDPGPHVAALAHHFTQAARLGSADRALAYLTRAGEQALAQVAWESATHYFERALALLDRAAPDALSLRCDLLLRLADARWSGGEAADARSTYAQAAELARRLESPERFARAAIGYAGNDSVGTALHDHRSVRWLEEALTSAALIDDALRVRVLCQLAFALVEGDDLIERRRALTTEALAVARRLGHTALLLHAFDAHWYALAGPDTLTERLAIATEELRLAEAIGDAQAILLAHGGVAADLLDAGDMHGFDRHTAAYARLAETIRMPVHRYGSDLFPLSRAVMRGQVVEAEATMDRAWPLGRQALPDNAADRIMAQFLFEIRREQERLAEIESLVRRFAGAEPPSRRAYWQARLALLCWESGQADEARRIVEQLAAEGVSGLQRDAYWLVNLALLGEVVALLGDQERAAILYDHLAPYPDRNVNTNLCWASHGSVSHFLGLLATTLGRLDAADRHFQDALAMHERMDAALFVARDRCALAQLLVQRHATGDHERARELTRAVLATSAEHGWSRLRRRADALAQAPNPGTVPAESSLAFGLTTREIEVVRLLVEGLSNQEIATALFIAPRTAANHVGNIMNKLGFDSRTAVATWAVRHGVA